jgi:hypothetical protein
MKPGKSVVPEMFISVAWVGDLPMFEILPSLIDTEVAGSSRSADTTFAPVNEIVGMFGLSLELFG